MLPRGLRCTPLSAAERHVLSLAGGPCVQAMECRRTADVEACAKRGLAVADTDGARSKLVGVGGRGPDGRYVATCPTDPAGLVGPFTAPVPRLCRPAYRPRCWVRSRGGQPWCCPPPSSPCCACRATSWACGRWRWRGSCRWAFGLRLAPGLGLGSSRWACMCCGHEGEPATSCTGTPSASALAVSRSQHCAALLPAAGCHRRPGAGSPQGLQRRRVWQLQDPARGRGSRVGGEWRCSLAASVVASCLCYSCQQERCPQPAVQGKCRLPQAPRALVEPCWPPSSCR